MLLLTLPARPAIITNDRPLGTDRALWLLGRLPGLISRVGCYGIHYIRVLYRGRGGDAEYLHASFKGIF